MTTGQLSAHDIEADEGYFSVGQHFAIVVHPQSMAKQRLRELRGKTVRLQVVVEDV